MQYSIDKVKTQKRNITESIKKNQSIKSVMQETKQ